MCVFRVEKNKNYTIMSNYHLQDLRISLKAKGLLSFMLSLPDDWDFTLQGLAACCKEGVDAIRQALRELEDNGYLRRTRRRRTDGRLSCHTYDIFEKPLGEENPLPPRAKKRNNACSRSAQSGPSSETPDSPLSDDDGDFFISDDLAAEDYMGYDGEDNQTDVDSLSDDPLQEEPMLEEPILENPTLENPMLENPTQINTNKQITNQQRTKEQNTNRICSCNAPSYQSYQSDSVEYLVDEIRYQIGYYCLAQEYGYESLDEIVELMLEVSLSTRSSMQIAGDNYPISIVKRRFASLTSLHIIYVFDCLRDQVRPVGNMHSYLLSTLFRAPTTIENYYKAKERHNRAKQ